MQTNKISKIAKELLTVASVAMVTIANLAVTSETATAVEGFQRWEHPFQKVQPGLDQQEGNAMCWQLYSDIGKSNGSTEIQFGFPETYIRTEVMDKYAWDGTAITYANHIWYHQQRGICVANTHW
jgi:hypothetical protein